MVLLVCCFLDGHTVAIFAVTLMDFVNVETEAEAAVLVGSSCAVVVARVLQHRCFVAIVQDEFRVDVQDLENVRVDHEAAELVDVVVDRRWPKTRVDSPEATPNSTS